MSNKSNGQIDNERRSFPSASAWGRYEKCGASFQLELEARKLGQLAHQGGAAATRGEMIHAWIAGEKVSLSPDDLATAEFLKARADEQITRIFGDKPVEVLTEVRLWLKDPAR